MTVIREFAPAKINLTLEVLGRRDDGYHKIKSLVAFADVGDVVTLDTSQPGGVTTSGPFASSIAGADLVETALRLIAEADPALQLGSVHVEKNLPVAAGIGGGSTDAAAVIRAVQRANPRRAAETDWQRIALRLGADVPVCLLSQLAFVRGIGETVAPLDLTEPVRLSAILVNPLRSMPADKTAQVFRALEVPRDSIADQPENHPAIRDRGDLRRAIDEGRNDLFGAAVRVIPWLADIISELGPHSSGVRMSGAGPTCFALFDTPVDAASAAAILQREHPAWWLHAVTLG